MTASRGDPSAWSPEVALLVEEACNRFEAAWRAGAAPRIEAYLGDTPEPALSALLRELLALEVEYRLGGGDTPTPAEYDARFPGHAGLIREVLAGARTDGPPNPTGAYEPADTGTDGDDRLPADRRRSGRFTPLRKHAQGGLGTVSVAFDETLRRQVALKAIRPDRRGNAAVRRRFLAEAEITGQLEHPGVVPVYALEEDAAGQPYYAMRFVQGQTLAEAIRAYHAGPAPLAFRGLLKRFVDVCQTIAYAHSRGVIHRDLKPANVLLGDYGETLVADWGLAKRVGGGPKAPSRPGEGPTAAGIDTGVGSGEALTEAGQVLGTPAYMAPEQAEGGSDAVGPAADVYALGAILYEVLTGQPPYRAAGMGDTMAQVRGGVPRALEAVCLKAMARSPGNRYAGPAEVAREVERWLADEPVTAYREPLPVRLARWGRHHRTLATAAAVVLLTLGGAAILGGLVVRRAQDQAAALAQADALPAAGSASVPALLKDLEAHRDTVRPRLWARWQNPVPADGHQRLRLGLALADDAGVRAHLVALARMADDPQEVLLVRDVLQPYAAEMEPLLWESVAEPATHPGERLRLLAILATLDPDSDRWAARAGEVVNTLVRENVLHVSGWVEALRPARGQLIPPLADVFRDANRPELERNLATNLLADYAADRPDVLADLLLDADRMQFAVLFPKVQTHGGRVLPFLTSEVDRKLPTGAAEAAREKLAKRQANAAVALLRMNQPAKVWPLLRRSAEPDDPRVRSYLIHRFGPLGADAAMIVKQLDEETDVTIRRALVLSLGEYGEGAWTPEAKKLLAKRLQDLYGAADPGLHAAAEWLLRQLHEEEWLRQTTEALARNEEQWEKRLESIRHELAKEKDEPTPRWYVNGQGQTMVVLPGPVKFRMGSPLTETSREPDEPQHRKRIGRTFAIAAKPVTVADYKRFRPNHYFTKRYAPASTCPVIGTNWYEAAAYCNWLSEHERIPPGQWCYETDPQGQVTKLRANYLSLTGYRLPTESEWEYACRAGAVTSRSYGESEELLGKYAWFLWNAEARSWPVGSKKPNDLGLFDMHGNVWNWCQDTYKDYPRPGGDETFEDKEDLMNDVPASTDRVSRGVSWMHQASFVRSATRNRDVPTAQYSSVGFRVARTLR